MREKESREKGKERAESEYIESTEKDNERERQKIYTKYREG